MPIAINGFERLQWPSTSVVPINPKEAIADKLSAVFHIQRLQPRSRGDRVHAILMLYPS